MKTIVVTVRRAGVFALLAAAGCTFAAGDWFVNLRPTFEARYEARADRDTGDGWQKLNTGYQVRVTRALMTVTDVQLQEVGAAGGGASTFDPAHPPAGYSLCHNGHCHRDDGALVPYGEIAAASNGGQAAIRTVVSLPVGEVDLLAPVRRGLSCDPGCGLEESHVRRARATVTRAVFEGLVRDRRSPARLQGEVAWRWEWALAADLPEQAAVTLDAAVELPADNRHAPDVELALSLALGARLLDDVEWAALARDDAGAIDLAAAANAAARELTRRNLAESELTAGTKRTD